MRMPLLTRRSARCSSGLGTGPSSSTSRVASMKPNCRYPARPHRLLVALDARADPRADLVLGRPVLIDVERPADADALAQRRVAAARLGALDVDLAQRAQLLHRAHEDRRRDVLLAAPQQRPGARAERLEELRVRLRVRPRDDANALDRAVLVDLARCAVLAGDRLRRRPVRDAL